MNATSGIDDAGNASISWRGIAGDLIACRDTLAKQRCIAEETAKKLPMPRRSTQEERSYWVEIMLIGFALENLLKALWVARGNSMYAGGKLRKIPGTKNHDLASIADGVGFPVSDKERRELDMLSEIMIGVGRYPMAPTPERKGKVESWSDDSDDVVRELIERLQTTIRSEKNA